MLHPTLAHQKAHLKQSLEEEEEEAVVALVEALMEGKSTTQRPYCFQHGYAYKDKEGHWGTTCNYMIQNEYNERFLNARSPCTIDGYVCSTKNV